MRYITTAFLGLFLFAAPAAYSQCCRPSYQAQIQLQPVYSMVPQVQMVPQITGFQPMAAIQQRIIRPTPFRDVMFGRYRTQYVPMGQPIQFQQQQSQNQSVPQHDHPEFRRDSLQESRYAR